VRTIQEFQAGDKVTLRSGGIPMTIERIFDGQANCVWLGRELVRRDQFSIDCLMFWSEFKPDFTLIIPGVNIAEGDPALLSLKVHGNA
jgi:uncharacterized protein YodC (DUF2158 family)